MKKFSDKLFICFSAKDRYVIAQPIVYHLKNYGINVWYDRYEMIMGDDRFKKNIEEGAGKSKYAIIILSHSRRRSKSRWYFVVCGWLNIQMLWKW